MRALREPLFAPPFHDRAQGFRRRRSCHTAMAQLVALPQQGYRVVVDAELHGFFDRIPHHLLLALVAGEMADGTILNLITKFLQAGVREEGEGRPTGQGTPQGGVIAPVVAKIVRNQRAGRLEALGSQCVRSADDCVVLCTSKRQAEQALQAVTAVVEDARGVPLNPDPPP